MRLNFGRFSVTLFRFIYLTAAILLISACEKATEEPRQAVIQPVKIIEVGEASHAISRSFPGTIRATQRVELAFQVPGQLIEFTVNEGQEIEEGQLLGKLDARDYVSAAKAAKAKLVEAQGNFKRGSELLKKKFISEAEYERLKAASDIARSELNVAEKALEDSELIAPFSGVVARTYAENFQDIQAKQAILSLQDNSSLEVVINVSETLIARQREKVNVVLHGRIDSSPDKKIPAYIKEFATDADPKTQTFRYVLGLEDTQGLKLLPGMTMTVVATAAKSSDGAAAIVIPVAALTANDDGQSSVWLLDEKNQTYRQLVVSGQLAGKDQIMIESGLQDGDRVVVAGVNTMYEGRPVKPVAEVSFK
jgi:RND family efflux transporter MFP subunit